MYFNSWIDFNASSPFDSIINSLNINSDFRFKTINSTNKITVKQFWATMSDVLVELETSTVIFNKNSNQINLEIRNINDLKNSIYKAKFEYDKENQLDNIITYKIDINEEQYLKTIKLNRSSNSIIINNEKYSWLYKFENGKLIEFKQTENLRSLMTENIILFYDKNNEIEKIEEFVQLEINEDNYEILEQPKLIFISKFKKNILENGLYEIESISFNVIENTNEKKLYLFDKNDLIIKETMFKENDSILRFNNYNYLYNSKGDWIRLECTKVYCDSNVMQTFQVFEREIEYNKDSIATLNFNQLRNHKA